MKTVKGRRFIIWNRIRKIQKANPKLFNPNWKMTMMIIIIKTSDQRWIFFIIFFFSFSKVFFFRDFLPIEFVYKVLDGWSEGGLPEKKTKNSRTCFPSLISSFRIFRFPSLFSGRFLPVLEFRLRARNKYKVTSQNADKNQESCIIKHKRIYIILTRAGNKWAYVTSCISVTNSRHLISYLILSNKFW